MYKYTTNMVKDTSFRLHGIWDIHISNVMNKILKLYILENLKPSLHSLQNVHLTLVQISMYSLNSLDATEKDDVQVTSIHYFEFSHLWPICIQVNRRPITCHFSAVGAGLS